MYYTEIQRTYLVIYQGFTLDKQIFDGLSLDPQFRNFHPFQD